ncbi:MAG: 2-oxo acid dehydrogenase subunit E2 [Dehalococcoidia bacterium]|nr:2-oxo acid dehydrogenase subunit E2 [Dehalococcoidia bacterium]
MATEVTMPQMGADMTEGTLVKWLKAVGDQVDRGEVIAEIETDKATVELEAFESGVLKKLVVQEGETVPVGQVIALLGAADEQVDAEPERQPPAETPARRGHGDASASARQNAATTTAQREQAPPAAPETEQMHVNITPGQAGGSPDGMPGDEGRVRVSPVARRIAMDAGLDLSRLKGTGPDGRILRKDVEAAISGKLPVTEPQPAARPAAEPARATVPATGAQPLSRMRQAIARRMSQSKQTAPHYYLTLDIDMTAAMAFRGQLNASASEEQRVSVNDLIVKACALALERHPKFNAEFSDAGLTMHEEINIDIGIALDEGLIAPAILGCKGKTLGQIARESKDLVARAKSGALRAEEYSAGTFTITNLGAYGVETLIGIINPPQAAILGVGSVMPRPAAREGQVVVRDLMKVALSADHRVTDGAEGARFIKEIQGLLENPVSLAL